VSSELERGSVVRVRFDPSEGSEIQKTRPAVIVSNNAACRFDAVVQVVPITRLPERPLRPYESLVSSERSGLARPSRLVANQVRTVAKRRVGRVLGRISDEDERALNEALRIQLALGY
jgi:mRNA interferase MazF